MRKAILVITLLLICGCGSRINRLEIDLNSDPMHPTFKFARKPLDIFILICVNSDEKQEIAWWLYDKAVKEEPEKVSIIKYGSIPNEMWEVRKAENLQINKKYIATGTYRDFWGEHILSANFKIIQENNKKKLVVW